MASNEELQKKNYIVPSILIFYTAIDLVRLFEILPSTIFNILYVGLGAFSIFYCSYKFGIKKQIPIFSFLFFYTIFGFLGIIVNKNIDFQEIFWPLAFFGVALLLLNFKIPYKLVRILYYFIVLLLISFMIFFGGVDNLEMTSSRNTISVMVLFYFSLYIISLYINKIKITMFPILVGLIATMLAIGRSGIITFFILVFLFSLLKYSKGKYRVRNILTSSFFIIVSLLFLRYSYGFLEVYFPDAISNFQNKGLESIRELIWSDYLDKTFQSIQSLVFGASISGTFLLEKFKDNLHNSFFMLHAKYGLIILLIIISLVIYGLLVFLKTRNFVYFILLIALLFRMQFDYTNFNAQLDIIFIYIVFYPFFNEKTISKRKEDLNEETNFSNGC